jgi:hypothetical protein
MNAPDQVLTFNTPDEDIPLGERIILRDSIAMFEKRVPGAEASADISFLDSLPRVYCWFGASDCEFHPFIAVPESPLRSLPTAASVLRELRAVRFKSAHIPTLDTVSLPYPGYHPGLNDEIHTESEEQRIFAPSEDNLLNPNVSAKHTDSMRWHSELRGYVVEGHVFYVLLHAKPHRYEQFEFSDWVVLFAVGVSPHSGYLLGAVTHQACHNYCD